jgi:hypothetical protein
LPVADVAAAFISSLFLEFLRFTAVTIPPPELLMLDFSAVSWDFGVKSLPSPEVSFEVSAAPAVWTFLRR